MTQYVSSRVIDAPIEKVFKTVSEIEHFSKAIPHIVSVDILSDTTKGVGTRFRETRLMNGKEATTELEVTEFVENEHVRLVADTHGTVWDSVFSVKETNNQTELKLVMDARAYKLLPKMVNPFIKGMIMKALEKDMDSVKAYCED